jgi:integrase
MTPSNKRAAHGAVVVYLRGKNNHLWLRWTHEKVVYRIPVGLPNNPVNMHSAMAKKAEIELAIALQQFDKTLVAYRPAPEVALVEKPPQTTLSSLFERFTEYRRTQGTAGQTIASKYTAMASRIAEFKGDPLTDKGAIDFISWLRSLQSPRIANQNLALIKSAVNWGVKRGLVEQNPFTAIVPLKLTSMDGRRSDHFTADEIHVFLDMIAKDPNYSHYHDLCFALFHLGLRPSEAIGLRWCHLNLKERTISIQERLARGINGETSGWARQRLAGTKNGSIRVLRLNELTYSMFEQRFNRSTSNTPQGLIFTSPRGNAIDDKNFATRAWANTCIKAGLIDPETGKHRCSPYSARHSFGRRLYESGLGPHSVGSAMGNSARTSLNNYGHTSQTPDLPMF